MIIALYWMTWTVAMYLDHCQEWPEWANVVTACISVVALIVALVRWHGMVERVKRLEEMCHELAKAEAATKNFVIQKLEDEVEQARREARNE